MLAPRAATTSRGRSAAARIRTAKGMSTTGFRTSAICNLHGTQAGKPVHIRTQMVDISSDGAQLLCEAPLAIGSNHTLTVDGYQMPELPVQVVGNFGDVGSGYRIGVRLTGCSWPYQLYSTLSSLAFTRATESATPPSLKALGLELGCSPDDVETAFFSRVRTAHPDRGGDIEAFVRLRSAYLDALELVGGKR